MKMLFSLIVVFAIFPLISSAQSVSGWKKFKEGKIAVSYPSTWTLVDNPQRDGAIFFLSPLKSNDDKFAENLNIIEQDLSGYQLNLEQYTEISVNQIKELVANSEILENKTIKKDGLNWQKVVYKGDQDAFNLHFIQYYLLKENKAYIFTFTSEQSEVESYSNIAMDLFDSFRISK